MLRTLVLIAWLLFVPAVVFSTFAYEGKQFVGGLVAVLACVSLPALLWYRDYASMCWVRQSGAQFGPMGTRKIALLQKAGKLGDTAQARKRWSEEWKPFAVLTDPPQRLSWFIFGGLLGLPAGLIAGLFLFGTVRTPLADRIGVDIAWVLEKPHPKGADPLLVTLVREGAGVAGDSGIPIVNVFGKAVQATDRVVQEHNNAIYRAIDNIRLSGLVGLFLVGGMLAFGAPERHRLVFGELSAPDRSKSRRARTEASKQRISFECKKCDKRLSVSERLSGEHIKCPSCGARQQVPDS